jgi:hypothetical protein
MIFEMPQYEVRDLNTAEWRDISEIDLMQNLHEFFDRVTPAIQQMIEGQQVLTQYSIYRLKRRYLSQLGNPGASTRP